MEVHHPSHSKKQKWTHYLWEFLMLFLAVFCGFMAENIREHKVEHQREKKLAINLYKELLGDSAVVQDRLKMREIKEKQCAYFINYAKDSSLTELSENFFPSFAWSLIQTQKILFDPNDGILTQLRNSGELRYFRSQELQTAFGQLGVEINKVRLRNDKEYSFVETYLRPFSIKHFDFDWYEDLTQHGKLELYKALLQNRKTSIKGKISNLQQFDRKEAQNLINYYLLMLRATHLSQYMEYAAVNHKVLELLRKEFHLK